MKTKTDLIIEGLQQVKIDEAVKRITFAKANKEVKGLLKTLNAEEVGKKGYGTEYKFPNPMKDLELGKEIYKHFEKHGYDVEYWDKEEFYTSEDDEPMPDVSIDISKYKHLVVQVEKGKSPDTLVVEVIEYNW